MRLRPGSLPFLASVAVASLSFPNVSRASEALRSECPELSSDELEELEARFRSTLLVRGRSTAGFVLRCSEGAVELAPLETPDRSWIVERGSSRLVERFLEALDALLTRAGVEEPAPSNPATKAPPPEAPEDAPRAAAATPRPSPSDTTAEPLRPAAGPPEKTDDPTPGAPTRLLVEPQFILWAAETPGALGLQLTGERFWSEWGFLVSVAGHLSLGDTAQLRPFEMTGSAGIAVRPSARVELEVGPLLSFLGVPAPDSGGSFGSSLRPGAFVGARLESRTSFGALFVHAVVRFVAARRELYIEDERVGTIPAVAPSFGVGLAFEP